MIHLAAAYEYQAITNQFRCDWAGYVDLIEKSRMLLNLMGIGDSELGFLQFGSCLYSLAWCRGKHSDVLDRLMDELSKRQSQEVASKLITAELEIYTAGILAIMGKTSDMLNFYKSSMDRNLLEVGIACYYYLSKIPCESDRPCFFFFLAGGFTKLSTH
jgi:hypothetical protein